MTDSLKAHISLFAAQIIYALNYSIAKDLMPTFIGPFALVLMRIIGAGLLFWLMSLFAKPEPLLKGDLKKLAFLAIFGVFINQLFFIWGLSLTIPINSAIIMISNPIIVIVFTLIILKERITIFKIGGLLIGSAGAVILLLFKGNFQLGSETIAGDIMTFINSTSWAVFVVMAKPYMQKYQTVTVMKWIFTFGSIYMMPFGITELLDVKWLALTGHAVFAISFVIVAHHFFCLSANTMP